MEKLLQRPTHDSDKSIHDLLADRVREVIERLDLVPDKARRLAAPSLLADGLLEVVETLIGEEVNHAEKTKSLGLEPMHMVTVANIGGLMSWRPICDATQPWVGTFGTSAVTCSSCLKDMGI